MPRPSVLLSLVLIAAPAYPSARLTYMVHGSPVPVAWTSFPISYAVDRRVSDAMGGVTQIDRAIAEWASVPGAEIAFNDLGVRDGIAAGKDGKSTISLTDELYANQHFLALTTNWYDDNGHVLEADIQIDPVAIRGGYNLAQLVRHETGHLLGLDHSAVLTSVMYPYVGMTGVASLDSDDRVAIANVYPRLASPPGATLQGRVSGDDGGIFAAQVVALNEKGEPVSTALSGPDGSFSLQGIPSGSYRIYAEPLDGPVNVSNLSGNWRMAKVTSFPTQFADGGTSIRVEAGKVYGNLNVSGAGAAQQLNPKWIGVGTVGSAAVSLGAMPVILHPGQTVTIAIGGDGFLSGVTTFDIPSVAFKRVSDFTWSGNYVSATFETALNTPQGSVVILAHTGNETAALTGALRIEPKTRGRAASASK